MQLMNMNIMCHPSLDSQSNLNQFNQQQPNQQQQPFNQQQQFDFQQLFNQQQPNQQTQQTQQPQQTQPTPPTGAAGAPTLNSQSRAVVVCVHQTCLSTNQNQPVCGTDSVQYYNTARLDCTNACGRRLDPNWQGNEKTHTQSGLKTSAFHHNNIRFLRVVQSTILMSPTN